MFVDAVDALQTLTRSRVSVVCCLCATNKSSLWLRINIINAVLSCSFCSMSALVVHTCVVVHTHTGALCAARAPLFPLSIYFLIFSPFHFSLSFIGFIYFLLLSIPSLSTRIVPLRFQTGGRRRRPNLGLVCVLFCTLCYLYSLVKMYCGALFYLV